MALVFQNIVSKPSTLVEGIDCLRHARRENGYGYLADEWKLIQAILRLSAAIIPEQFVLLRKLHTMF